MIRQATMKDVEAISAMLPAIVGQMNAAGNFQWNDKYPLAGDFVRDVEVGSLYVFEDSDGTVGGFVCVDFNEPKEYGAAKWSQIDRAMVVHRMAVSVNHRGLGIAKAFMSFADQLALSKDVYYLKTDTNAVNEKMQGLFASCGYVAVGDIKLEGKDGDFRCFEKVIEA